MPVVIKYTVDEFVRVKARACREQLGVSAKEAERRMREFIEVLLEDLTPDEMTEFPKGSGTFYRKLSPSSFEVTIERSRKT